MWHQGKSDFSHQKIMSEFLMGLYLQKSPSGQWFSNLNIHKNNLEDLLNQRYSVWEKRAAML